MLPSLSLPPLEFCLGTSPTQAEKSRPDRKALASATLATSAVASAGPTPGIASSRLLVKLDQCQLVMRRSNFECRERQDTHGPPRGCVGDDFQQLLDAPAPDGGEDTELGKIRADRIDDGGLLADEQMARSMKHQTALLLGRHETHVWPGDRFVNRLSVRGVVLLPLDVGLHIGRRHQAHGMPQQFAGPMVR